MTMCRFRIYWTHTRTLTKSPADQNSNDMDYSRWQAKKRTPEYGVKHLRKIRKDPESQDCRRWLLSVFI